MNIEKIKMLMKEKNIDNNELAKATGVSGAFIGQMLNGFKKPSVELAVRIAEQLGCLLDDIVVKPEKKGENKWAE